MKIKKKTKKTKMFDKHQGPLGLAERVSRIKEVDSPEVPSIAKKINPDNLITIPKELVDAFKAEIDKQSRDLTNYMLLDSLPRQIGFSQAAEYSLLTLKDGFGIQSAIPPELSYLVTHIGILCASLKYVQLQNEKQVVRPAKHYLMKQIIKEYVARVVSTLPISTRPPISPQDLEMTRLAGYVNRKNAVSAPMNKNGQAFSQGRSRKRPQHWQK